jgi:hypothetical protein
MVVVLHVTGTGWGCRGAPGLSNLRRMSWWLCYVLQVLVGDAEDREEPNEEDIAAELYDSLIPPYRTSCSQVSLASAIPLVNR